MITSQTALIHHAAGHDHLSAAEIEEMLNTRMSPEHDHLNRLLDEE
jgi:hypothetical protein